jgi:hypothetical protein
MPHYGDNVFLSSSKVGGKEVATDNILQGAS